MSSSALNKKLKSEKISFKKLLLESRMALANKKVKYTMDSISRIATTCSYSTTSYSISVFRAYYGVAKYKLRKREV